MQHLDTLFEIRLRACGQVAVVACPAVACATCGFAQVRHEDWKKISLQKGICSGEGALGILLPRPALAVLWCFALQEGDSIDLFPDDPEAI